MTLRPLRLVADDRSSSGSRPPDADVDIDTLLHRFQSLADDDLPAHRAITPLLFAMTTMVPLTFCQSFHHVLFTLLEDVGDFDGLIATPELLVAGTSERMAPAHAWLAENPAPGIDALLAAGEFDDSIARAVTDHSQALAVAVGTNPSLTFGSLDAVTERLVGEILEIELSCEGEQMRSLTAAAAGFLACLPATSRVVGGATVLTMGAAR